MRLIDQINNLHWRFPKKKAHVRLENLSDFELHKIRNCVQTHNSKHWFAVSSDQWYNDVTYLLQFRKKEREIVQQIKINKPKP